MLAFAAIGGLGLLLLVISMTLGEVFDLLDGVLSGTALGAGATLFGAGGVIVLLSDGPFWLAYTLGAVLGLLGIFAMWLLTRKMASISDEQPHEVLGLQGIATTDINRIIGKVQLSHPYEINQRLAVTEKTIDQGTPVTVVAVIGERVKVAPTSEMDGA